MPKRQRTFNAVDLVHDETAKAEIFAEMLITMYVLVR